MTMPSDDREEVLDDCTDTFVKDQLMDAMVRFVMGSDHQGWPTRGDKPNDEVFHLLAAACRRHGIKVLAPGYRP
jgi:hypothetical protein